MSMECWIALFIVIALAMIISSWSSPKPKKDFWESWDDSIPLPTDEECMRVLESMRGSTQRAWNKMAWEKRTSPTVLSWMTDKLVKHHKTHGLKQGVLDWVSVHLCAADICLHPNLPTESLNQLVEEFWDEEAFGKSMLVNPRTSPDALLKLVGSQWFEVRHKAYSLLLESHADFFNQRHDIIERRLLHGERMDRKRRALSYDEVIFPTMSSLKKTKGV